MLPFSTVLSIELNLAGHDPHFISRITNDQRPEKMTYPILLISR